MEHPNAYLQVRDYMVRLSQLLGLNKQVFDQCLYGKPLKKRSNAWTNTEVLEIAPHSTYLDLNKRNPPTLQK